METIENARAYRAREARAYRDAKRQGFNLEKARGTYRLSLPHSSWAGGHGFDLSGVERYLAEDREPDNYNV